MSNMRRLGWSRGLVALVLAGGLAACGSTPRTPYTASEAAAAVPVGLDPSVRAYADASEKTFTEMSARPENSRVPFAYLALSGGGGDGAYGRASSTAGRNRASARNSPWCRAFPRAR